MHLPDLSFFSWARMHTREYPATPIAGVVPNLAVAVLSEGNARKEIERRFNEQLLAGVESVWVVDPHDLTVAIHNAPNQAVRLGASDALIGGAVLPGSSLPLAQLFARLPKGLKHRRRNGK